MLNALYHIVGSVTHSIALCSANGCDHVTGGQDIKTQPGAGGSQSWLGAGHRVLYTDI